MARKFDWQTGVVRKREVEASILLAPQSGHVSNSFGPTGTVIELMDAHCFQADRCNPTISVHAGHPVWTRLELAWGAQDTFRIA